MPGNTIDKRELEDLGIMIEEEVLEVGVQDEYGDKIAAEYIEKLTHAKNDKNSVLYKAAKLKQHYQQSDLHKSTNRIIYKIEPLRVAIKRESIVLKQAVAEGNKQLADEVLQVIAKSKLEKNKLEQSLSALMSSANKLKFAS